MGESILNSTKKLLGVAEDDKSFDTDIIMHINTVFADLVQVGGAPDYGTAISDETAEWETFLADDLTMNNVRTYMYFRVRLMFDPPQAGPAIAAMEKQVEKLEWRLNLNHETKNWVQPSIFDPPDEVVVSTPTVLDGGSL